MSDRSYLRVRLCTTVGSDAKRTGSVSVPADPAASNVSGRITPRVGAGSADAETADDTTRAAAIPVAANHCRAARRCIGASVRGGKLARGDYQQVGGTEVPSIAPFMFA